jgi:hypothetical protein
LIGGVQTHVRDLSVWLLAQGHTPVVYGPAHGRAAAQLARFTVPVTDDLATVRVAPDIIHGNSPVETLAALLHFTETPAVFVCHSWKGREGRPPDFPRIRHLVAVDATCADRLVFKEGVPEERVTVLLNAVDTSRFPARATPLPARPARALVFGNAAHATRHVPIVQQACRRASIAVDVVGELAGTPVEAPERLLGRYDLIFARAKCALEGLASGAAVIVCDGFGLGGLVTSGNVDRLRQLNFGIRTLGQPLSAEALSRAIAAYDPVDAARVSERIRATAASHASHEQYLALYEQVIREHAAIGRPADFRAESRAAAAFLQRMTADGRASGSDVNRVAQATHRVLQLPLVGPALSRLARWAVDRGRVEGQD